MVNKQNLVLSTLDSLIKGRSDLTIMDFGCGEGVFAQHLRNLGHNYIGVDIDEGALFTLVMCGFSAYHPADLPKSMEVDILLLGNMSGIETGIHLINARKLLKEDGTIFMWDFSRQKLPKEESQETVVMSIVSKEG